MAHDCGDSRYRVGAAEVKFLYGFRIKPSFEDLDILA